MNSFWRPIDAIADWLRDNFGFHAQLRAGIVLLLATIPLYVWAFFTPEALMIYLMSALALTYSGITMVIAAEGAKESSK